MYPSSGCLLNGNATQSVGKSWKITLCVYIIFRTSFWLMQPVRLHCTVTLGNLYRSLTKIQVSPTAYILWQYLNYRWLRHNGCFYFFMLITSMVFFLAKLVTCNETYAFPQDTYGRTLGRTLEDYLHSSHFASSFTTKCVICSPI